MANVAPISRNLFGFEFVIRSSAEPVRMKQINVDRNDRFAV